MDIIYAVLNLCLFLVLAMFFAVSLANMMFRHYFREKEKYVDRLIAKGKGDTNGQDDTKF